LPPGTLISPPNHHYLLRGRERPAFNQRVREE